MAPRRSYVSSTSILPVRLHEHIRAQTSRIAEDNALCSPSTLNLILQMNGPRLSRSGRRLICCLIHYHREATKIVDVVLDRSSSKRRVIIIMIIIIINNTNQSANETIRHFAGTSFITLRGDLQPKER